MLFKVDPEDIYTKFQGYFNNDVASQSKVLRDVLVKGDAYVRTGDVLRWDSEGRWWFCDRIGDTFRWKSENISTAEVSEVLGTHPRSSKPMYMGWRFHIMMGARGVLLFFSKEV